MKIRGLAQSIQDFEGGRLLALDPDRIDGIHNFHAGESGHLADEVEGIVKISLNGQELGAVHKCLGQFAESDLSGRNDHGGTDPGPRGVGRSRGGGVAGAGTDHELGALRHGMGHGHGHAAILEGGGGVESLVFQA